MRVILGGRFRIIRKLGEGGSAEVYLVEDIRTHKKYALKLLKDKKYTEKLLKAYELASKLNHPNIVKIYETGRLDGKGHILVEYVDGIPLNPQDPNLKLKDKIKIASQIIDALSESHKKGIMHKDLKPENILITKDLKVKLTDFGLARDDTTSLMKTGEIAGTPAYISPEELKGEKPTKSSDIFSLGVILYELFTGLHPFRKNTISQTLYNIINKHPSAPDNIRDSMPEYISRIIQKCLLKTPKFRYPDAQELKNDWIKERKVRFMNPRWIKLRFTVLLSVSLILGIFYIFQKYKDIEPYKAYVKGTSISVFNKSQRKLFSFKAKSDITTYMIKDIDKDGKNEVIVGTGYLKTIDNNEKIPGKDTGAIYILDYNGKTEKYFGNFTQNIYNKHSIFSVDILKSIDDSSSCILVGERCGKWFPYAIRSLCLDKKNQRTHRYWHSGWIFDFFFDDVNNDGIKDIIAGGVNNDLGMKPVVFALNGRGFDAQSPPWFGRDISEEYGTLFYTVLPGSDPVEGIKKIKKNIFRVNTKTGKVFYISNMGVILRDTVISEHHIEIFNMQHFLIEKIKQASTLTKSRKDIEALKILTLSQRPYINFIYPLYASLSLYRGIIEQGIGNLKNAIRDYKNAAKIDREYAAPYLRLGFLYFNRNNFKKAQEYFEKAYYLSFDQWAYFYSMVSMAFYGDFKGAIVLKNNYAKKNDAFFIYFSSLLFYVTGHPDSTLENIKTLKNQYPHLIGDESYPESAVYIDLNQINRVDTTRLKDYPDLMGSYLYRKGAYKKAKDILLTGIPVLEKEQNSILSKIQLWRTQYYLYLINRKMGGKEQSKTIKNIHIKAVVL